MNDVRTFQSNFSNAISEIVTAETTESWDNNELWTKLKECMLAASSNNLKTNDDVPRQQWMSVETLDLIKKRKSLRISGCAGDLLKEYNFLNREIQKFCRQDKNQHLATICMDLETHALQNNSRDLFQKVKLITNKCKRKTWAVIDEDGNRKTDIDQIVDVWQKYCHSLYSDNSVPLPLLADFEQEPPILFSEVEAALNKLKSNKAAGADNMTAEILKALGQDGKKIIHQICQKIWSTGKWPDDWKTSIFIPLHKKGPTDKCNNYRLLALISHASKILLYIIQSRLQLYTVWQIAPEQAGFVKGRGTREQILNLRQLIEKAREYYVPVYMCFVDYQKAFDNVKWSQLWEILLTMGVPKHLIFLLRGLYEENKVFVRIDGFASDICSIQKGVRQGCVLSPLLFNIYSEFVMRSILEGWEGGVTIGGVQISNLRFADDTTLIASSEHEITTLLERLENISQEYGLHVNYSKTKIMIVDRANDNRPEVTLIGRCEVVSKFIYLGAIVNNTGGTEEEIRRRIQLARTAMTQLYKIWRDRQITKNTKIRLIKALVFSIFLYASESWTVKTADRRRIDAFEMWVWRRMLRIPWTAMRTNASIIQEIQPAQRLSTTVYQRVLTFFGHVQRSSAMERLVVQGKPNGKRRRGRSPQRWVDVTTNLLNMTLGEAVHLSNTRDKWRTAVSQAIQRLHV